MIFVLYNSRIIIFIMLIVILYMSVSSKYRSRRVPANIQPPPRYKNGCVPHVSFAQIIGHAAKSPRPTHD